MNFLTNSEYVGKANTVLRPLELENSNKLRLGESSHEVLDFVKFSDVTGPEGSAEEAVAGGAGPAVLVGAVPDGHGKGGVAREGRAHQVLLARDLEVLDRVLRGKGRHAALGHCARGLRGVRRA